MLNREISSAFLRLWAQWPCSVWPAVAQVWKRSKYGESRVQFLNLPICLWRQFSYRAGAWKGPPKKPGAVAHARMNAIYIEDSASGDRYGIDGTSNLVLSYDKLAKEVIFGGRSKSLEQWLSSTCARFQIQCAASLNKARKEPSLQIQRFATCQCRQYTV